MSYASANRTDYLDAQRRATSNFMREAHESGLLRNGYVKHAGVLMHELKGPGYGPSAGVAVAPSAPAASSGILAPPVSPPAMN